MVYINEKRGVGKLSILLVIFCVLAFHSGEAVADEVLTASKDIFTVTHPKNGAVKEADFQLLALDFIDTIEKFAYPNVPPKFLEKIKEKTIRIEFTPIARGGGFIAPQSENSSELLIQLNSSYLKMPAIKSRLIHEWFHALHFIIHPNESPWIREGLAQVFVALTSDGSEFAKYPGAGLIEAMKVSTTPLKYPFKPELINSEAYGHVFFYFYSLYQNCGKNDIFWKLAESTPHTFDEATINYALEKSDPLLCGSYKNTATQAEIARFHNHVVYSEDEKNRSRYFIFNEFPQASNLKLKSNPNLKNIISELPPFQPLLVAKEDGAKLKALKLNESYQVFQLLQDYPYSVTPGLTSKNAADKFNFIIIRN